MEADHQDLIEKLALDSLGMSYRAVLKWRQRQVPHRWRLPLIRAAAERGVVLRDSDFLLRTKMGPRPRRKV